MYVPILKLTGRPATVKVDKMAISKFTAAKAIHKDIDAHTSELGHWLWDVFPLTGGDHFFSSEELCCSESDLLIINYSTPSKIRVQHKRHKIGFLVACGSSEYLPIGGIPFKSNTLFFFSNEKPLEIITPPGFTGYFYTFSENHFKDTNNRPYQPTTNTHLHRDTCNLNITKENLKLLKHGACLLQSTIKDNVSSNKHLDDVISTICQNLINPIVLDALINTTNRGVKSQKRTASSHLKCFVTEIDNNLESPPSIATLAEDCSISVRQVQKLFKQYIGLSPTEYIKALRLNAVRLELIKQRNCRGAVSSVANQFGFWHMGQFAKDFKLLFGYLPTKMIEKKSDEKAIERIE